MAFTRITGWVASVKVDGGYIMIREIMTAVFAMIMLVCSAQAVERTALVAPSRKLLVDVMFDVRSARPGDLEMVCYSSKLDGTHDFYVFDQTEWRWRKLALSSWREGRCFRGDVSHVVFFGGDRVPDLLRNERNWEAAVSEVESPSIAELLIVLDKSLSFKLKHWKVFSANYDLILHDMNRDQRRYGRYGPPVKRTSSGEVKVENGVDLVIPVSEEGNQWPEDAAVDSADGDADGESDDDSPDATDAEAGGDADTGDTGDAVDKDSTDNTPVDDQSGKAEMDATEIGI